MKTLPIEFDFDFAEQAKAIFTVLKRRAPLPLAQEIRTEEHLAIDQMVFDYFGFSSMKNDTQKAVVEQVAFRTSRSAR